MTTTTASGSVWDTLEHTPSSRQSGFLRYLTATLVDLVVLNLFIEYWKDVSASSFTITVLAAVLCGSRGSEKALQMLTTPASIRQAAAVAGRQPQTSPVAGWQFRSRTG